MILYVILFILILSISAYLAYLSMRDFYDLPEKDLGYSLFLIKNPVGLTTEILDNLSKKKVMISFERLFRADQSALVLYAPRELAFKLAELKPLEIEDYTKDKKGRWHQFVILGQGVDFLVEKRVVSVEEKLIFEVLSDYKKRKFSPLGKNTLHLSSKQLLSAILLPQ